MNHRRHFLKLAGTLALNLAVPTRLPGQLPGPVPVEQLPWHSFPDVRYLGRPPDYWICRLHDSPGKGSWELREALACIGEPVLPELISALDHPRVAVRGSSISAIMEMGPPGRRGAELALSHRDPRVRLGAVNEVVWRGEEAFAQAVLAAALNDNSRDVRRSAAMHLGTFFHGRHTATILVSALADPDFDVRRQAIDSLGHCEQEAILPVADAFRKGDTLTRILTASFLVNYPRAVQLPDDPMRVLMEGLHHEDSRVRKHIADCMFRVPDAVSAVPQLVRLLDDRVPSVRAAAITSLGELQVRECTAAIIRFLRCDSDVGVRAAAADALREMNAREAVPVLEECLSPQEPELYTAALPAYARLVAGPAAIPAIADAFRCDNARVRNVAGWCVPRCPETVRFLADEMKHDLPQVRLAAARSLRRLGEAAVEAIDDLGHLLRDPDLEVQWAAAQTLLLIRPEEARRMVPFLNSMISVDDAYMRQWAAETLLELDLRHARAAIASADVLVRAAMANALADHASRRRDFPKSRFSALLAAAARDDDLAVRAGGVRGLRAIQAG